MPKVRLLPSHMLRIRSMVDRGHCGLVIFRPGSSVCVVGVLRRGFDSSRLANTEITFNDRTITRHYSDILLALADPYVMEHVNAQRV